MSPTLTAFPQALVADRSGLLGSAGGVAAGLPPAVVCGYVAVRLLIPVLLILFAGRDATPEQRIALVREHLAIGPAGRDEHR